MGKGPTVGEWWDLWALESVSAFGYVHALVEYVRSPPSVASRSAPCSSSTLAVSALSRESPAQATSSAAAKKGMLVFVVIVVGVVSRGTRLSQGCY